jgi:hypothetical protein
MARKDSHDKTGFYLVVLVAIVAILGIAFMVWSSGGFGKNAVGNAFKSPTKLTDNSVAMNTIPAGGCPMTGYGGCYWNGDAGNGYISCGCSNGASFSEIANGFNSCHSFSCAAECDRRYCSPGGGIASGNNLVDQ